MKILLINNHTRHLESLNKSLSGHEVEIQMYQPGIEFKHHGKDLVILSGGGGEGLEIHDEFRPGKLWYDDQMRFVRDCDKPIIGICMGFEVIARAYGSEIKLLKTGLIQGFKKLAATDKGKQVFKRDSLEQFEAHEWVVTNIDETEFEVLATSKTGIEAIRHKKRDIFATQFHPEKGGSLKLSQLIERLALP